uniref:Deleted in malignant brain tumors 1 protein-like n=1 Tax=Saccoglossus kowalevskii TaxID=10224 RepID=A0ABM0H1S3_SACKO
QGDYPARCDFQDDLCNWIQVNTDDFDWLRHKGSTSTPNTGPNSDHSGNTDHYYMYMEATGNTIYDSTKLALAQQFKSTTDGSCKIRFFYHMYGTDVDELKLKMLTMTSHRETEIFKQDGNEGDAWHLEKITLNSSESFQLFFVAVVGRNQFADIAIDDISFTTGCQLDNSSCALPEDTPQFTCLNSGECISEEHTCDYHHNCIDGTDEAHDLCDSRPGQCDFQDGFCSWKQSCHDDFDWKRIKGQNSVAGPYRDHSLRNSLGFYAYIDASAQQTNEVAELRSLTLSTSPTELCKIRFYYYMYGTNFGTLKVIVKDKYSNGTMEKWAISGENAIRLVGGSSAHEGRVEVWYDGQWGTVCDDDFGTSDARVICLELGYPNEDGTESFGPGSGPIWLSHLSCLGNEASVFECHNDGLFNHLDCDHSEDAGVRCVASGQSYQIRLSGGRENVPFEGRVEIYHNGEWGTICDPTFGNSEAAVVCNQLGYDGLHEVKHFGPGVDPILIGSIDCCGHESSLAECEHSNWGVHTCSHSQDVGVICKYGPLDYDDYQGRLQIYHDHEWGTICSLGWTTNSATVACKQLGFSVAIVDITDEFGEGNGPIHLSQVQCSGTESSLSACNVQWGGNSCDHSNDVGIKCANSQLTLSLLTDTTHNNEGCLHLQDNEGEKQVCLNGGTPETLTVICRELGFSAFHSLNSTKKCSPSGLSRVMSLANCVGDELQLTSCSSYAWISAKGLFCSDTNGDRELVCTAEMTTSVSSLSTQSLIKSTDLTPTSNPVECIFNIITTCNNVQHSATYSCTDRIAKIWSPNHPKIYETDRECSWKVQSTTQDAITIQFEAFMTEPNYDYLYIYDGNSVQSKSLGEYSGSRFPQSVTTSTNQVYIKFDSNHVTTLS